MVFTQYYSANKYQSHDSNSYLTASRVCSLNCQALLFQQHHDRPGEDAESRKYDPCKDFASLIASHELHTWETQENIIICSLFAINMRVQIKNIAVKFNVKALFCFLNFIKVQLTYNVVLIFAVQKSDSVIHTHTDTHTHTHIYILFHYGLSQDIEHSSLCYTVVKSFIVHSISFLSILGHGGIWADGGWEETITN